MSRASLWYCTDTHRDAGEFFTLIKYVFTFLRVLICTNLVVLIHVFEVVFLTDEQVQVLLPVSVDCLHMSLTNNNVRRYLINSNSYLEHILRSDVSCSHVSLNLNE